MTTQQQRWSAALMPLLIVLVVLLGATGSRLDQVGANAAEPAGAASASASREDSARIAYARSTGAVEDPAAYEIFTMAADGSDRRRLTNNDAEDTHPAYSPDGSRIAFASDRHGAAHIYVMDVDGGDVERITNSRHIDALPEWSPDGRWIVFTRNIGTSSDLFKIRATGRRLTRLTDTAAREFGPEWSPDGKLIAFTRMARKPLRNGVYAMRPDGSRVRLMARNPRARSGYSDYGVTWSPSGGRLAFSREDRDLDVDIFSVARDGSSLFRHTDEGSELQNPTWSGDGRIAMMAGPDIGVMLPSGGPPEIITPDQPEPPRAYEWPDWSPAR